MSLNFADNRVYDPALMRWLQTDPIGLNAGNNDYAFVSNGPTDAVDPSGLQTELMEGGILADLHQRDKFDADPSKYSDDGVLSFPGYMVMNYLSFRKNSGWFGLGGETLEYTTFAQGCMGLNKLRLNTGKEPFNLPGARAFATLEAAVEAQKEMIRTNFKRTAIVITAYQDNYLDEQLKPFLLPGSKTEYDMAKIKGVRGGFGNTVRPKGNLEAFDFVTVHQNPDLTVRFYETMDFGVSKNPNLVVKHKTKLYPPERAGTIYLVTPIEIHSRLPLSPRGKASRANIPTEDEIRHDPALELPPWKRP